MTWPPPVTLRSTRATLEPLDHRHRADLIEAVKDGELWNHGYTSIPRPEGMTAEIDRRQNLQKVGSMLPFAVIDNTTGKAVGMTTYMNIEPAGPRLEIGSTWYAARVQRTPLNTEAKRLLLAHAFDGLGCLAVEFRTHVMNHASRRAIERLGARLDGILRHHQRLADGSLRDTCVYSVTAPEWPTVRAHLTWQLERPR